MTPPGLLRPYVQVYDSVAGDSSVDVLASNWHTFWLQTGSSWTATGLLLADWFTVTVRTGSSDTLAVYPIETDTRLVRDGEDVDDLSAFRAGDVVLVRLGADRRVSAVVAVDDRRHAAARTSAT